ncbi:MAG: PKD domain-containing protein [Bacteroidia bacterium]
MRLILRPFILFLFIVLPYISAAQQNARTNDCPGVPGACGYPANNANPSILHGPNPTPQNGNGTLGNIYQNTACGLNFSTASQRIGQRFTPVGVGQPAPFVISGIPSCAVIQKAYLWAEGSGTGAAQTATINGPFGTGNYPMAIVGQGPDKCWSYAGSYTYRADVTASIGGNGTYNISGLLTNPPTSGNDMDGATLLVVWSDPTQTYRGTIIIDDGAIIINGGVANHVMSFPAVCGATSGAQAFFCVGDIQFNPTSWSANGTPAPLSWNWWDYKQVATTVAVGQTTSAFNVNTGGDCFNLCVAGLYYRTTCVACTPSSAITLTTSATPASCSACNGTATVNVTPAGSYTYSWNTVPVQTGPTATGLCAGTYTVTVTSTCGTSTATVTVPTIGGSITLSNTSQTNVTCNGSCNGSAVMTASGGVAPYTFVWSPVVPNTTTSPTTTATGLCAGVYTCTATDAGGCTGTQTVTITQPPAISATQTQVNITCNGACTGSATVLASGGNGTYTYSWAPVGGTSSTATGLCAGTYTCTISSPAGCTYASSFTITQPPVITATQSQVNVTCNGACNGSATVLASGGTGTYTYAWAPTGGTGPTATALCPGTYTCTISSPAGCSITQSFTITQPPAITATQSQVNITCNAACTGSATVVASGGTGTYTYLWSPSGGTGSTATGLCAGNYTCLISSPVGCTITQSFTITQPPALTITFVQTNVSCNGGCNGTATVTVGGGTPPYTYLWSPTGGTGSTESGLCAGTYTCTVTDANGCTITQVVTITQPTALTAITSFVSSTCGNANGSATATPSGGVGSYTYLWTPSGQTTATATGLLAGPYSCDITDFNGCVITVSVTVTNTGSPALIITGSTDVTCNAACDGTATVSASGGTSPYTYAWTPSGGNGTTATALCPGIYTCIVTDFNGCTATATVLITEPSALSITPSQVDLVCFGVCNGSATATVTGGTPGYTYAWSPSGGNGVTATGLCAGNYSCLITDLNGCTITQTFTITEPTLLTVASAGFNVTCFGACDGQVVAIPNGGTPNYTFSWNTGCTGASCNAMCAGTYTVIITDMNGCTATSSATVTEPTDISIATSTVAAHCSFADGSASCTFSGGTGTLTPVWYAPASPGANLNNVVSGSYYVVVTDGNGCDDTANVTIANIPGVTASAGTITPVSCFGGNNGAASVNSVGGTGIITYAWSCSPSVTNTANNLVAGPCSVVVTDSAGCTSTVNFTINEPTDLTIGATATPGTICAGQTSTLTGAAAGGTPGYSYAWMPGSLPGATNILAPPATTTYTVYVIDANLCADSATVTVTVNPNPVAMLWGDSLQGCAPQCVQFLDTSTLASGTIVQWLWDFGDATPSSTLQDPYHCYTTAGTYSVTLTVASSVGCTNTFMMPNYIQVFPNPVAAFTASPQPTTELNPTIYFTDQSIGNNSWSWSFGDLSGASSVLQDPVYTYPTPGCFDVVLSVATVNGCVDTAVQQICIVPDVTLFVPNAFTPNGDGVNDIFYPVSIGMDPEHFEMWIFDRWGNMIYYTNDLAKGWDGMVQGHTNPCQQDVYVWKIKANDLLGNKHNLIGHVTLVR